MDELEVMLTEQLEKLRDQYITATPRQRAHVALQRLEYPEAYPNLLVSRVAGIEALARTLLMHTEGKTKDSLRDSYPHYRYRKTQTMVEDYCKQRSKVPAEYFGEREWRLFKLAVQYRNLLVHECTFLANYKFEPLENACRIIFNGLARLARLKARAT